MSEYSKIVIWVEENYFDFILDGVKGIEARAGGSERHDYGDIEEGDILKFQNEEREPFMSRVEDNTHYESVTELFENENWKEVVPDADELNEAKEKVYGISDSYPERIEKHGIYAIELGERLNPSELN